MGRVSRKYPTGSFFLRTPAKVDEEKLYPVYLNYFCGGKKIRQSTDIRCMVKDWNPNANHGIGELRASYGTDYRRKNQQLQKQLRKVDGSIFDYVEMNGAISPDIITAFINGDDRPLRADKGQSFVTYAFDLLLYQYTKNIIRISTYMNSVSIINQFKKCMDEMGYEKKNELFVSDMNEDIVRDFIAWGLRRGRKTGTIEKYKELISKVCRHASNDGLLSKTSAKAIAQIKLERKLDENVRRTVKYLTFEELGKLIHCNSNCLTKRQIEIIEMFFFAFYSCGLRISDIITLKWCNIDWDTKELFKIGVKNRDDICIPLRDEALKILERWKGRHNDFVFGLLEDGFDINNDSILRTRRNSITSTINGSLKRISKKAELNKKVTFHAASYPNLSHIQTFFDTACKSAS